MKSRIKLKSILKIVAIYGLRCIMHLLHLFPMKKNRIIFFSYHGNQYSCNPKYISEYLEQNMPGKYELIWAFRHPKKYEELKKRGIKTCAYFSLRRLYYEATATVSINNIGSFSWNPTRRGQLHINTFHGGGCYKRNSLGESRNDKVYKRTLEMTAEETTLMLASADFNKEIVIPKDLGFGGEVLASGLPRNDLFFWEEKQKKVRQEVLLKLFGKDMTKEFPHILLYAPTWRYEKDKQLLLPDFEQLLSMCKLRFGGEWSILFRAHHWSSFVTKQAEYIDVSDYPDMQELLVASDILLSDYSSCIWDYSLTGKPCLLFVPDLEEVEAERGFFKDIHTWGFPVCESPTELYEAIRTFDEQTYKAQMKAHHQMLDSFEKGHAAQMVAEYIEQFCAKVS